jgi:threonine dehydratase
MTGLITKDDVDAALERIRRHVHETPLLSATRLGNRAGGIRLTLKCESFQRTGSFKARGALNAMMQLSDAERAKGVVAVSVGNHAQALAWAATTVGSECVAVMPAHASATKVEATKGYGGKVELIAGVATALKAVRPNVRVIGVEPEGAPTMRRSLDAGSPQTITVNTVADGLAAPIVGQMNLDVVTRHVDDVVLVSEDEILAAMRDLFAYAKLVVEPAAAAGVAGLLSGKIKLDRRSRVVAIVTGGNVDIERLGALL